MSFAFNSYPADVTTQGSLDAYYEDVAQITEFKLEIGPDQLLHDEPSPNLMRSFQQPRPYSAEPTFIPPYSVPAQQCVADEYPGVAPVMWGYVSEQDLYVSTPPEMHPFTPLDLGFTPETFSVGGPAAHYSNEHTYTRMFRGRKSKSAAEVLDELRPYACDICQAAFARSHDRDRHKRSHTGETPYRCHGCGTGFKRPDARKRHWERDPVCAQEDWLRVRHTPEGAKRRARAKTKPSKKQAD